MKVRIIYLSAIIFPLFVSCRNQNSSDYKSYNQKDTVSYTGNIVDYMEGTIIEEKILSDTLEEQIIAGEDLLEGIWAENEEENAKFWIKGKQIQYFEYENWFDYLFKDDTITVFEEGHTFISYKVIKLSKDSLILQAEEYIINLYKR
jgi:hypothetical protein